MLQLLGIFLNLQNIITSNKTSLVWIKHIK